MSPLEGTRVIADVGMAERPLCRLLATLGAEICDGRIDATTIATTDANTLERADFLVDAAGLERLADRGITREQLEALNPSLVHVSVTPFGSGGERARWRGGELVASAMGGTLCLTGAPDRPPVKEALDACTFHAEMVAAAGAMAAWYSRLESGLGQHVDVSIQEVAFSRTVSAVQAWQFDRRKLHRVGNGLNYGRVTVRCIWRLADGWCFHSLMTGRFGAPANRALSDWMDETGLPNPLRGVDWLSYDRSALDAETRAVWESAIDAFFATRTRADIRAEGRRRGINACVVEAPGDVPADPHLNARDFWVERNGIRHPSRFVRITAAETSKSSSTETSASSLTETSTSSSAEPSTSTAGTAAGAPNPPAGENAERCGAPSRHAETSGSSSTHVRRGGPLAGIRILDFSWALVGSISTKILGDLGADVIKVESRKRPCLSRLDVQVSASRRGDLDDKPWFAHLNTSKRSLALDLKRPESREVIDPLLGWADAVVENFSPGTMDKLGLGYAALSARHPGLVMASGSVYGQTGPLAQEWGVDGTGGALSGRTFLTGWPDRDPVVPGAVPYGDVIVPYVMAACVIAALGHRRRGGAGCHIDAAMYEICVQQMAGAIEAAQRGSAPRRMGNTDPAVRLQDVYPARGENRWVAISAFDEADLSRLERLTGGLPIAEWTAERDEVELVALLQHEGIAAGVVQDIEDLVERDATLLQRGALIDLPHPKLGSFGHMRTPISFSRDVVTAYRAPSIGEHGREIARTLAGVDGERLAQLEGEGVFE